MNRPWLIITILALVALSIYLFVQAPPPLKEATAAGKTVPIEKVLTTLAAENDVMRAMWTNDIVGEGQKVGLAFGERWQEPGVEQGPLPALLLRASAANLQKTKIPVGLFLGSDAPISKSNLFTGRQAEVFATIRQTRQAQTFYADDIKQYTAMFPDYAVADGCVTCHNQHPNSPKKDWTRNDMMGATTWTFPRKDVTREEYIDMIAELRGSFKDAYKAYLAKAATFAKPPQVGEKWPKDGLYLPTADIFMAEHARRASAHSMDALFDSAQ